MYKAVLEKGIPVKYILFKGEQHGFRKAESIKEALDSELYFFSRVFKFDLLPEAGIKPINIDNIDKIA